MDPIKFIPFDGISKQEWFEKITLDLKGKLPSSIDQTWQDIPYSAFYHHEDAKRRTRRQAETNDWLIRKSILITEAKEFNAELLSLLNLGLQNPVIRGEFTSDQHLKACLDEVVPDYIRMDFELLGNPEQYAWIDAWLKKNSKDYSTLQGGINLLGNSGLFEELNASYFPLRLTSVYGSEYQARGAFASTELALVLNDLNAFLEYNSKVDATKLYQKSQAILGVGLNFFGELAKLRAGRNLIDFLFLQYGAEVDDSFFIASQTSSWTFSAYDRHNNLLRNASCGLAAALGGASAIELLPHDFLVKKPNHFSTHLGVTLQHLMKEESYLNRVSDPSAGSYFIEDLTQKLEEQAWRKFQKLQAGASAEEMIEHDRLEQKNAFDSGEFKLLGVNLFPNLEEKLRGELEIALNGLPRLAFETEQKRLKDE